MFIIKKNDFTTAATFRTKADARNYLSEHHFDLTTILMEFGLSPPKCIQQGYKRNIPSINDFVKGRFKEKEYMITRKAVKEV